MALFVLWARSPQGVGTPFYGLYEELHPKGYLFCVKWYIIGLRNGPRGGALPVQNSSSRFRLEVIG